MTHWPPEQKTDKKTKTKNQNPTSSKTPPKKHKKHQKTQKKNIQELHKAKAALHRKERLHRSAELADLRASAFRKVQRDGAFPGFVPYCGVPGFPGSKFQRWFFILGLTMIGLLGIILYFF